MMTALTYEQLRPDIDRFSVPEHSFLTGTRFGRLPLVTFDDLLHLLKFFNGHDRLMCTLNKGVFDFAVVVDLLLLQIIGRPLLMIGNDTAIERVLQYF